MVRRGLSALALALGVAACAPVTPVVPPSASTAYSLPDASAAWYRASAARGERVLALDTAQSLIVVTVRRGGPLARLGHDHVVASHAVSGMVNASAGRADFGFQLDALVVDEAPLREQARLDTQPSADAIAGTRQNMLTRVLEAERYPVVTLRVDTLPAGVLPLSQAAQLTVTLHGVTRTLPVQIALETSPAGLTASGLLSLRQSDFGITPMSIMNGAMTVQDEMELRYRLVAR